jgi:hypothetical protein
MTIQEEIDELKEYIDSKPFDWRECFKKMKHHIDFNNVAREHIGDIAITMAYLEAKRDRPSNIPI